MTFKQIIDNYKLPHYLYLARFNSEDGEEFCKIGVTKNNAATRFKKKGKYSLVNAIEFQCENGTVARGHESLLLSQLIPFEYKYRPKSRFEGYSECYRTEHHEEILSLINYLLSELNPLYIPKIDLFAKDENHEREAPNLDIVDFELLFKEYEIQRFIENYFDDDDDEQEYTIGGHWTKPIPHHKLMHLIDEDTNKIILTF
jgi:hypothetical protein